MPRPSDSAPHMPARPTSGALRARRWFTHSLAGRAFLTGVGLKLIVFVLSTVMGAAFAGRGAADLAGSVAFLVAGAGLAQQMVAEARRQRLLWPVRRKLTTSYVVIGFVPALLIITFFALCTLLLFFNVSSYLMELRIRALEDQGRFLAQAAVLELQRVSAADVPGTLAHRRAAAGLRYRDVSYAVVPARRTCAGVPEASGGSGSSDAAKPAGGPERSIEKAEAVGPWTHIDPPRELPPWISCSGFAGLIAYQVAYQEASHVPAAVGDAAPPPRTHIAVRAVAIPDGAHPMFAVVVDIPITLDTAQWLREETGIELGDITAIVTATTDVRPMQGRADAGASGPGARASGEGLPAAAQGQGRGWLERPLNWFAFLDFADWQTGRPGNVAAAIGMSPAEIYRRVSATPVRIGNFSFGQVLLVLLSLVGGLFLVIESVAFVMGLGLARSITGSIHELFIGTSRISHGDFSYKIPIRTRDQLGDLAESFNSMTSSIEDLLRGKAEKDRLEQELRIARDIQMSLLPQGPLQMPGISLTGYCEPAREVGGDYYDFLPIDDHRLGVLIADVSGKGTSAALYMAELKGLMLALSLRHRSPRELLIDANRIIADHLDARSLITITYAIVDVRARTFTYARAGHCPLIHVPGPRAAHRAMRMGAPDGMALGLKLDKGEMFERLLCEESITLMPGDLVMLFTDGISEAMNDQDECFGETRLCELLEAHRDLPFEELRDRLIQEVHAFAGDCRQHDDMTMVLLKAEA